MSNNFKLRKRKKGDLTPWPAISPEELLNLSEQEPKVAKLASDMIGKRRPVTPKICEAPQVTFTSFESDNLYNLLREETDD